MALSIRQLSNVDLGYHLAYGDEFLRTGRIVDGSDFIWPPPDTANVSPDDIGPGCWIDDEGNYRFPNANWLSQVIMSGVKTVGGWQALSVLPVVLMAIILTAQAGLILRARGSWAMVPAVWLLTGLVSNERLMLRPELFGYACLAVQLWLLCGRVTWRRVGFALGVQLLAVNLHSYWLLCFGVAVAFAGDTALRAWWARWVLKTRPLGAELRGRLIRLACCAPAMFALSAVHPSTLRNTALPFQTLAYLRHNHIAGESSETLDLRSKQTGTLHPWAMIGEFHTPFGKPLMSMRSTKVFIALLAAGCAAALVLAAARRWALAGVLAAFLVVGLSMRRNIAPAGIVGWPIIAVAASIAWAFTRRCLADAACSGKPKRKPASGRGRQPPGRPARRWPIFVLRGIGWAGLGVVIAVSSWWTSAVATNEYYLAERWEFRFGLGLSRLNMPLEVSRWLDKHLDRAQPVFADYNSSSDVLYFCRKIDGVPVLTNTWAYPPSRMSRVLNMSVNRAGPGEDIDAWPADVVVLRVWDQLTSPLARRLLVSPDWALVRIGPQFAVFLRDTPANAELIRTSRIAADKFDYDAFLAECKAADPVPAWGVKVGATTLDSLGWGELAERLWRECVGMRPDFHEAWGNLGAILARRGDAKLATGDGSGMADLREARKCFDEALRIKPGYETARKNWDRVDGQIRQNEALGH